LGVRGGALVPTLAIRPLRIDTALATGCARRRRGGAIVRLRRA
jgi:hypothetical protein